jgi:hypothetical protein
MKPGVFNLDLYRGDDYTWRVMLWNNTARTVPTDLTGATAAAEIRDKTAGSRIVTLGCTITAPNIIDVTMLSADWAECPTSGIWDLQVTSPDGLVRTVLAGTVKTTGDVVDSIAAPAASR